MPTDGISTTKILLLIGGGIASAVGAAWKMDDRIIVRLMSGMHRIESAVLGMQEDSVATREEVIRMQVQMDVLSKDAEFHHRVHSARDNE